MDPLNARPDIRNTVTLNPELRDARRLPVAPVTFQWGDNNVKLAAAARDKAAEMMDASGAKKVRLGLNYGVHAMGSCRIGNDAKTSVVKSQKATFMPSASARSF